MALLWNCQGIRKTFSTGTLFANVSLSLEDGERLGLMGQNGSGKSTLLKIIANLDVADEGTTAARKGLRTVYLPQFPTFDESSTVLKEVERALAGLDWEEHERQAKAYLMLAQFGFFDGDTPVRVLSGGMRKRLALAQVFVREPDLVLLDEPTNHLDLEGILLLEELLREARFALVVTSHDRSFLQNTTRRIAELDRRYDGGLFLVEGGYADFLARKDLYLNEQAQREEVLSNKVRRELEWLNRGAKARSTKASARIQNAELLQDELADVRVRNTTGETQIAFAGTGRKTRKLITAKQVTKGFGERRLFQKLNLVLSPEVRLGLLGLNGSGKSTLLKVLAGEVAPEEGRVEYAEGLRVVYFDQMREQLDPSQTLRRVLAPDSDSVRFHDRLLHVVSYAKRFQFRAEQLDTPVARLSGGEQARLLIARLMLQPADVLLLDEPTNDLDIGSLESLEESLMEFPGAVVLVTHDRYLMDRVSTVVLGLDGQGGTESLADLDQWVKRQRARKTSPASTGARTKTGSTTAAAGSLDEGKARGKSAANAKRLTYNEQREWSTIEARIAEAEDELARCQSFVNDPALASDALRLQEAYTALEKAREDVDRLVARWAELAEKQE